MRRLEACSAADRLSVRFYGTYLSDHRGSVSASETIGNALRDDGFDVDMVSSSRSVVFRVVSSLLRAFTDRSDVVVVDVFSSRVIYLMAVVARIISRRNIPIIAILHGGALVERYQIIKGPLTTILNRSSRILSPSGYLTDAFCGLGMEVDNIPNAIQLSRFPYRERKRPGEIIHLLWVRAFTAIYRPEWPVEIVSQLRMRGIDCTLTMVGPDKGLLNEVKARAVEFDVADHIEFTGPVPNDELYQYYHAHDFLLNTTEYESFGIALVEAASTGLPIVSAAVGEVQHAWQDEENIFLVPGQSSEEFADRIADLHESDLDGTRYCHVSRRAHEKVSKYAMENIMPRWQSIIESVSNGRTR